MSQFLVTLQSTCSAVGALGVVDPDLGLRYLQIDKKSSLVRSGELRGVAILDDRVFITTPASLRILHVAGSIGNPLFALEREVTLPEWVSGDRYQADILPLLVSRTRQRIYLASNALASIEILDLNGDFMERRHLWMISPQYFRLPDSLTQKYPYGHIRSIVESPHGRILAVVAFAIHGGGGLVVDVDSGEVILKNLVTPHGGVFLGDSLVMQNTSGGTMDIYRPGTDSDLELEQQSAFTPEINSPNHVGSVQNLRGMLRLGDEIFSGVCNFTPGAGNQIPPRIVAFDIKSRAQTRKIPLPSFRSLGKPRVFFMAAAPDGLVLPPERGVTLFRYGNRQLIRPESQEMPVSSPEGVQDGTVAECMPVRQPQAVSSICIRVDHVSLAYRRVARMGFGLRRQLREEREFWALRDISFSIGEGEVVGLIGRNGSGKSTLGMLMSGSMHPDKGSLETYGKVQLLSLGLGFQGELTGRQNALINGTLLGLRRSEILAQMADIDSFSELGDFMDEPVRTYSAGMKSRLAFAVATIVRPDILILDEVLSTGDQAFRSKAEARMRAMHEEAKTVVIVSHNGNQLKKLCTRIIWLEKGCLMLDGEPKQVLAEYLHFSQNPAKWMQRHQVAVQRLQ